MEELGTALSHRIGLGGRMPTLLMGKRKARFGYPPGSLKARFFQSHLALPGSLDFPPEINRTLSARLLGLEFFGAEAPQNEIKLPENQDIGSFLRSRKRPTGPKIGRKEFERRKKGKAKGHLPKLLPRRCAETPASASR
jgi:hypothetical protein